MTSTQLRQSQQSDIDRICAHMGCEPVYEGPAVRGRVLLFKSSLGGPRVSVVSRNIAPLAFRMFVIRGGDVRHYNRKITNADTARSYTSFIQDDIEGVAV